MTITAAHIPAIVALIFVEGFGAGLAATFFTAGFFGAAFASALRALAGTAALPRAGRDDFDFAAVFFGLAAALAMAHT